MLTTGFVDQPAVDALFRDVDVEVEATEAMPGGAIGGREITTEAGAGICAQVSFIHGQITGSTLHSDRCAVWMLDQLRIRIVVVERIRLLRCGRGLVRV